jgi:ABC-2 type transport system ATP-binding protein
MLIRVRQLRKTYGPTRAIDGIDLDLEPGGIVGLLGPNGAGKTTLVETLEGLRTPTSGEVSVLGLDPSREPRELKERIGVQLQSTAIQDALTASEVLSLYASFYRKRLAVSEVLARVGLAEKARARAGTLSGGQRQRLAIGMALIHDPELILLDEPTTGLDPAARRGLHELVRDLKKRGRTVLLTTHYIEEAETLCDRVIVLRSGKIVADGTPFELLGRAAGWSTVWVEIDGGFDPLPLLWAGAEPQGREGRHHRFRTLDPAAFVVALGRMLEEQKLNLIDLRLKRPTLEDVYLDLVGFDSAAGPPESEHEATEGPTGPGAGRQARRESASPADGEAANPADRETAHPADGEAGHPARAERGSAAGKKTSETPDEERPS